MMGRLFPLFMAIACDVTDVHPAAAQLRAEQWAKALNAKVEGVTCHHCRTAGCHCEVLSGTRLFALFCDASACQVRLQ